MVLQLQHTNTSDNVASPTVTTHCNTSANTHMTTKRSVSICMSKARDADEQGKVSHVKKGVEGRRMREGYTEEGGVKGWRR